MSIDLLRQAARNSLRELDDSRTSLVKLIDQLDAGEIELSRLPQLSAQYLECAEAFSRAFRILERCGAQYQQVAGAEIAKWDPSRPPPSGTT